MDCWQSFSYLLFSKVLACTVWSSRFSGGGGEEPPEDRCSLSSWCTILMVSETPSFCCVGGGTGARGAPAGFGGLGGFGAVTGAGLGATSGAGAGAGTGPGAGTVSGTGAGAGVCDDGAWGIGSGTGSGSAWKAMIFSSGWGARAAGGGATTASGGTTGCDWYSGAAFSTTLPLDGLKLTLAYFFVGTLGLKGASAGLGVGLNVTVW